MAGPSGGSGRCRRGAYSSNGAPPPSSNALVGRSHEALEAQGQSRERELLRHIQLERLPRVLAALDGLSQAAWIAPARGLGERCRAIRREHRAGGALGEAEQIAERERRQLKAELEHLGARAPPVALGRLLELTLERLAVAPLRLVLEPRERSARHLLLRGVAARVGACEQRPPRLLATARAHLPRETRAHEPLHVVAQLGALGRREEARACEVSQREPSTRPGG